MRRDNCLSTALLILFPRRTRQFLIRCTTQDRSYNSSSRFTFSQDVDKSFLRFGLLPVGELDGQNEQDAEHDGPAEQSGSPGHQDQQLPERLSHPAQHYRRSSALCPIYRPRLLSNTSIRQTGGEEASYD